MTTTLVLDLGQEISSALVREYFEYCAAKASSESLRKSKLQQAEAILKYMPADEYLLFEDIPRVLFEEFNGHDTDPVAEIFDALRGGGDTIYRGDIQSLITLLREGKRNIRDNEYNSVEAIERIESGPIAICEFALKNDFGVRLSH